jgi:2-polyprenyl-6-methoxyphenol hydroxylase-like FAD-dependent oxidoreductase
VTAPSVLVVGAGPIGLALAGELALAGVPVLVADRLPVPSREPKANGIVGESVRWLDHRGLYAFLGGEGVPRPVPAFLFGALPLDLRGLPAHPLYGLGVPQRRVEELLAAHAAGLGVEIRRGCELVGLDQDAGGVTAHLHGPDGRWSLRTDWLVGCDGGHSTVRRLAGIDFPGTTADDTVSRAAQVVLPGTRVLPTAELELPAGGRMPLFAWTRTERGVVAVAPFTAGATMVSTIERDGLTVDPDAPMTLAEMRASLHRVLGPDLASGLALEPPTAPGPHVLRRRTGGSTRLAESFRRGRVLLAGDAAHVQSGVGAPGLNLGLQDVADLGWKLAAQIRGWAPPGLLDTYHRERHAAGERVQAHTLAQSALMAPGPEVTALRGLVGEALAEPAVSARVAALLAGAEPRAGVTGGHALTGRFAPELTVTVDGRPARLAELARSGRPLLLDLGAGVAAHARDWADRVDVVVATHPDPPAGALLVRPDGVVAWAGTGEGLHESLQWWFGPAQALSSGPCRRST